MLKFLGLAALALSSAPLGAVTVVVTANQHGICTHCAPGTPEIDRELLLTASQQLSANTFSGQYRGASFYVNFKDGLVQSLNLYSPGNVVFEIYKDPTDYSRGDPMGHFKEWAPGGDQYFYSAPGGYSVTVDGMAVGWAVPEPSTWLMLLCGFGVVGAGLRRRSVAKTAVAV